MELKLSSIPAIENNALLLTGVARSDFENYGDDLPENLVEFIENFNTLSGFYEKMKAICEAPFTDKERLMILEQVPLTYKNYYLQVGPERLRANGYNITKINNELKGISKATKKAEVDLSEFIYSAFEVGGRYSLVDVKIKLQEIYKLAKYDAVPKSTVLDKYFITRKVRFPMDDSGKRAPGLEILNKKS